MGRLRQGEVKYLAQGHTVRDTGLDSNLFDISLFLTMTHAASFFFFFSFLLFRVTPAACGSSQAGLNWSYSFLSMPQPEQCRIQAESATYTTVHSNAGSLTRFLVNSLLFACLSPFFQKWAFNQSGGKIPTYLPPGGTSK